MRKSSRRSSSSERQLLYGVNPIVEALRADRVPDQITIAEGARDERLRELIEECGRLGSVAELKRQRDGSTTVHRVGALQSVRREWLATKGRQGQRSRSG